MTRLESRILRQRRLLGSGIGVWRSVGRNAVSDTKMSRRTPLPYRLTRRSALKKAGVGMIGVGASALLACNANRRSAQPASGGTGGTQGANEQPQPGGTLTFFLPSNAATLDPQRVTGHQTMTPVGAVMSRLFRAKLGPTTEIALQHGLENDLATSAESPEAVTWTIKLRQDARFHNVPPVSGHAVEAEDIKATFARALDPAINDPSRGLLDMIDLTQIQTPTKDTIVFKLRYPYSPFPTLLATPLYAWIYPREVATNAYDPAKQIIGSGPFIFDSYTPDVAISLKKNPDWFEKGRPYVDGVRIAIITDTAQQIAQFEAGQLDILNQLQEKADMEAAIKANPKAKVVTTPATSVSAYYFQLGDARSPWQDIRLRQAVSMAIDRETLGKVLFENQYDTAFSVPPSQGTWSLKMNQLDEAAAGYYKFNLAEAKKLYEAAGASGFQWKLMYLSGYGGTDAGSRLSETIHNMLQALSKNVTLASQEYLHDFVNAGKGSRYGNYSADQVIEGGTAPSIADVDGVLFGYWHSKSASNESRLKDPKLDGLIDKARTLVNQSDQLHAYLEVQKYIAAQVYSFSGLPVGSYYTLVSPRVRNVTVALEDGNDGEVWSQAWLAQG